MSPTIVLRDDRPILTIGAAGGPTIISQVLLGVVRFLDLGLPLDQAVGEPRFHHQWFPNVLTVEKSMAPSLVEQLGARGHELKERDRMGVTQAIAWSEEGQAFLGVHDPRVPGRAAGP